MMKIKLLLLQIFMACIVFAQHKQDNLKAQLPDMEEIFIQKVKIIDTRTNKNTLLQDGNYTIADNTQQADISIEGGLINGTVTIMKHYEKGAYNEGENFKTNYKIEKSLVNEFTTYVDGLLFLTAHREAQKAYYKEYYIDNYQKLKSEGWKYLDKNKHYGFGVTKSYDKNGIIYQIIDDINLTTTMFYPNGNKESFMDDSTMTYYNEAGVITRKSNFKTKPFHDDQYVNGKIYSRFYKNDQSEDVKEYFKNGVKEKIEITKTVNGEKITFVYNKSGKLIDKHPYFIENEKL